MILIYPMHSLLVAEVRMKKGTAFLFLKTVYRNFYHFKKYYGILLVSTSSCDVPPTHHFLTLCPSLLTRIS